MSRRHHTLTGGSQHADLTSTAEDVVFLGVKGSRKYKEQLLQNIAVFTPVVNDADSSTGSSSSSSSSSSSYESRWDRTAFKPIKRPIVQPVKPSNLPTPTTGPGKEQISVAALPPAAAAESMTATGSQKENVRPINTAPPAQPPPRSVLADARTVAAAQTSGSATPLMVDSGALDTNINILGPGQARARAVRTPDKVLTAPNAASDPERGDLDSDTSMFEDAISNNLQVANTSPTPFAAATENARKRKEGMAVCMPPRRATPEGVKHTMLTTPPSKAAAPKPANAMTHPLPRRPDTAVGLPRDALALTLTPDIATPLQSLHIGSQDTSAPDWSRTPEDQEDRLERMESQAHDMLLKGQNWLERQGHHEEMVRLSAEAAARYMRMSASISRAVEEQRALTGHSDPKGSAKRRKLGTQQRQQIYPDRQILLSQGVREREEEELRQTRRSRRANWELEHQEKCRDHQQKRKLGSLLHNDFDEPGGVGMGGCNPSSSNSSNTDISPRQYLGLLQNTATAAEGAPSPAPTPVLRPALISYSVPTLVGGALRRVATSRVQKARNHPKVVRFLDLDGAVFGKYGDQYHDPDSRRGP